MPSLFDWELPPQVPGGKFEPEKMKQHWESEWGWIEDVARTTAGRPDEMGAGKVG